MCPQGITYIYYQLERTYDSDKRYTIPVATTIGKVCMDNPDMMIPNDKYLAYFPDAPLPEEKECNLRSGCIRIGAFIVIRKIITDYHLDEILKDILDESGLFLDLAAYAIITENNAGQYYPDYAYNHPLLTDQMKIYSDTKVSRFINGIKKESSIEFLNRWSEGREYKEEPHNPDAKMVVRQADVVKSQEL